LGGRFNHRNNFIVAQIRETERLDTDDLIIMCAGSMEAVSGFNES